MSLEEFIRLEARALRIIDKKDSSMTWKAVESGAMERVRLFAENHNYEVNLEEITDIIWNEICYYMHQE